MTEHDHRSLITEHTGERHGHRLAALLPSDPAVVAVMRLAAAALVVALVLWMIR